MSDDYKLRVAAAQFSSAIGDVDANIDAHLAVIDKARRSGVELLVLPEVSLTGHHGVEKLLDAAMHKDDARLSTLAKAAGSMAVSVGFIEEGPAAQFYNSSAVLRNGEMLHVHRKINLPNYGALEEGKHYAAGRFIETITIKGQWNVAILICADVWNPALTHLAFLQGATLLACPVSSAVEAVGADFDNPNGWELTSRFYSMMYGAPMIMANRTGAEYDLYFWGGSRIIDPFGRAIATAGSDDELIIADLDYCEVRRARQLLPTVRDSNLALVMRETERLADRLGIPDFVRE